MNVSLFASKGFDSFAVWLLLGLPAVLLWGVGGLGAVSLLARLSNGTVVPGIDSMVDPSDMWGTVVIFAICGQILGVSTFFLPVRKRILRLNLFLSLTSLFVSVLASS
jgi:hypothetical protein